MKMEIPVTFSYISSKSTYSIRKLLINKTVFTLKNKLFTREKAKPVYLR